MRSPFPGYLGGTSLHRMEVPPAATRGSSDLRRYRVICWSITSAQPPIQVVAVPRMVDGRLVVVTSLELESDTSVLGWAATPGVGSHAEQHARELGERLTLVAGDEVWVA